MRALFICLFFGLSMVVQAHPAKMTTIEGTDISLHTKGHSFAGRIKNNLVSGYKVAGKFESYLTIIHDDSATLKHFTQTENALLAGEGAAILHFDQGKDTFALQIGKSEYQVAVSYESFSNNHFINPTYTLIKDAELYSFKIEGGAACIGYSAHLIIMIFGTLFDAFNVE